jgi:hypothetical protein
MSKHMRAVIAGNYKQYVDWCREQEISPRTGDAFYATPESLRGRNEVRTVRTGTWQERDDLREIEETLLVVNRFGEPAV